VTIPLSFEIRKRIGLCLLAVLFAVVVGCTSGSGQTAPTSSGGATTEAGGGTTAAGGVTTSSGGAVTATGGVTIVSGGATTVGATTAPASGGQGGSGADGGSVAQGGAVLRAGAVPQVGRPARAGLSREAGLAGRGSATRALSTSHRMRRSVPGPLHPSTTASEARTSTVVGSSTEATSPTAKTPLSMTRPGAI